jgi:DNA-directed RNA polymerase subunit RPC12/RpoP
MELLQIKCPTCHSAVLQSHTTYTTQYHGRRSIYQCANCPGYFSETKKTLIAGLNPRSRGLNVPAVFWG